MPADALRRLNATERVRLQVELERNSYRPGASVLFRVLVNSTTVRAITKLQVTLCKVCAHDNKVFFFFIPSSLHEGCRQSVGCGNRGSIVTCCRTSAEAYLSFVLPFLELEAGLRLQAEGVLRKLGTPRHKLPTFSVVPKMRRRRF